MVFYVKSVSLSERRPSLCPSVTPSVPPSLRRSVFLFPPPSRPPSLAPSLPLLILPSLPSLVPFSLPPSISQKLPLLTSPSPSSPSSVHPSVPPPTNPELNAPIPSSPRRRRPGRPRPVSRAGRGQPFRGPTRRLVRPLAGPSPASPPARRGEGFSAKKKRQKKCAQVRRGANSPQKKKNRGHGRRRLGPCPAEARRARGCPSAAGRSRSGTPPLLMCGPQEAIFCFVGSELLGL